MLILRRDTGDLWIAEGPDWRFMVRALSLPQALRKAAALLARFQEIARD